MRSLLRFITFAALALWSATLWGAYGLVSIGGDLLYRSADRFSSDPETVEWLAWFLNLTQDLGLIAIVVTWGLGALIIGVIGFGFAHLFARREPLRYEPVRHEPIPAEGPRPQTAYPEILPPEPRGLSPDLPQRGPATRP